MMPAEAGNSQAGRTSKGWTTDIHAQSPNVRFDHARTVSSNPASIMNNAWPKEMLCGPNVATPTAATSSTADITARAR